MHWLEWLYRYCTVTSLRGSAGIVHGYTIPSPQVLMIESSVPFSAAPILKL